MQLHFWQQAKGGLVATAFVEVMGIELKKQKLIQSSNL
jgi:hypothetical protein